MRKIKSSVTRMNLFPSVHKIALGTTLIALCLSAPTPNALAQTKPMKTSIFLDAGSMGGDAPIDDLALIDADELLRARGGPIRLTLQAQKAPLSEILAQVSEQSGLPFRFSEYDQTLPRLRVSPAIADVPFWRAMRELLTPVETRFSRVYSPDGLFVDSGLPLLPGRAIEAGPLLLVAERTENQSSLALDPKIVTNLARESRLTLVVNVGFEPRLLAEPGMTHCRILEARDDTGAALSLITGEDASDVSVTTSNWSSTQLRLPFRGLSSNAHQLSVVRGVISVPVWSGAETWEINDLASLPLEKTFGSQVFRLEKVGKERDGGHTEAVVVVGGGKAPFDFGYSEVSLYDEAGRELSSSGQSGAKNGGESRFLFNGTPKTAIMRVRHSLRRIEVPWEMRDLPLP